MSKYESRITGTEEKGFYALIVRVDHDSQESVIHGYSGRHFATRRAAEKSTSNYINRHSLNG